MLHPKHLYSVFGAAIFICIPLPYMHAVNLETKGFKLLEEWFMLSEYDDGAFTLFMIEATFSYHS